MKKVYVAECALGRGLFTAVPLRRGEPILAFTGRLRSLREIVGRPDSFNMLQVGARVYMDLEAPGVYANHACEPNVGLRSNTSLIALRDLSAGEELRYDYSTTMGEDLETMPCRCGMSRCRGLVQDFRSLPLELKQHYVSLGIVQDFILWQERLTPSMFELPQVG